MKKKILSQSKHFGINTNMINSKTKGLSTRELKELFIIKSKAIDSVTDRRSKAQEQKKIMFFELKKRMNKEKRHQIKRASNCLPNAYGMLLLPLNYSYKLNCGVLNKKKLTY